jgi:hypothetical protein
MNRNRTKAVAEVKPATLADTLLRKEKALAQLRELELARKRGELAEVEVMGRLVEQDFAVLRERLLTLPGKLAFILAMRPAAEIQAVLTEEIYEALDALSAPAEIAARAAELEDEK